MVPNEELLGVHVADGDLFAYQDGELSAQRRREVVAHMRRCPICVARLHELRSGSVTLSHALTSTDVRAPIGSPWIVRRRAGGRRFRRRAAVAAAAALLLTGGVAALTPGSALRSWLDGSSPPVLETHEVTHFAVTAPDTLALVLVDGRGVLLIRFVGVAGPRMEVQGRAGDTLGRVEFAEGRLVLSPGTAQVLRILVPFRTVLWVERRDPARGREDAARVSAPLGDSVDVRWPPTDPTG